MGKWRHEFKLLVEGDYPPEMARQIVEGVLREDGIWGMTHELSLVKTSHSLPPPPPRSAIDIHPDDPPGSHDGDEPLAVDLARKG